MFTCTPQKLSIMIFFLNICALGRPSLIFGQISYVCHLLKITLFCDTFWAQNISSQEVKYFIPLWDKMITLLAFCLSFQYDIGLKDNIIPYLPVINDQKFATFFDARFCNAIETLFQSPQKKKHNEIKVRAISGPPKFLQNSLIKFVFI